MCIVFVQSLEFSFHVFPFYPYRFFFPFIAIIIFFHILLFLLLNAIRSHQYLPAFILLVHILHRLDFFLGIYSYCSFISLSYFLFYFFTEYIISFVYLFLCTCVNFTYFLLRRLFSLLPSSNFYSAMFAIHDLSPPDYCICLPLFI